uniref:non-specific serine/threonine protein kinase n=1 Tax=Trypanosoma congolense (strain IL3000) TaxID=1068625 RepID=G0UJ33_TRYCI|nr:putative protein kinase [Trypanosoma congolense IL3000]
MSINPALWQFAECGKIPHRRLLGTRYFVVAVIGNGTFGEVLLVKDREAGGTLAVAKSFRMPTGNLTVPSREQQLRQVVSEARIMALFVNNDDIVRLLDLWCEKDGRVLFLMEYCAGGDLEAYLQSGRQFSEELLRILFVQCLLAVALVHAKGIVHHDIKPSNILLAKKICDSTVPILKLADFGLSTVENGVDVLRASGFIGTPLYMSPETTLHGMSSFCSDVWSLGVVFYRLMTKTHPFDESDVESLRFHITYTHPPHPSSMTCKGYTRELGDLVMAMLNKSVKKRPSARHLLSSPLFSQYLQQSPWRSHTLQGTTCFFACCTNRAMHIFAEPHFGSKVMATLSFGDHVFVSRTVSVRTVLQQCGATGAVSRIFTWDEPVPEESAANDGSGVNKHRDYAAATPPAALPGHAERNPGSEEDVHTWCRVLGPQEGYCIMHECGRNLLQRVCDPTPCGPLLALRFSMEVPPARLNVVPIETDHQMTSALSSKKKWGGRARKLIALLFGRRR